MPGLAAYPSMLSRYAQNAACAISLLLGTTDTAVHRLYECSCNVACAVTLVLKPPVTGVWGRSLDESSLGQCKHDAFKNLLMDL